MKLVDRDGRTALMNAATDFRGYDIDIIKQLIELGSDINHQDSEKYSCLHFAARGHHIDILRCLLNAGAEVDPVDVYGNTPLCRAVLTSSGNYQTVEELLSFGADAHKQNLSGISPIKLAETMGNTELLLKLKRHK